MKYLTTLIFGVLLSFNVLAGTVSKDDISLDGLTQKEVAELVLQIEQKKEKKTAAMSIMKDPDALQKWADAGQGIGKAIGSAAKELGIAADEFSRTAIGKIVVLLIVWKVAGAEFTEIIGEIWSVFFGIMWLLIMLPSWWFVYKNICYDKEVLKIGDKEVLQLNKNNEEGMEVISVIALCAIAAIGILPIIV